jgi:hypothetical protein
VNVLAISPAGHVFAGTSTDGVFHSTDSGAHWIQSNSGMLSSFVTCLAINSSGHIFAGTFSEGVYRSTDDGANWTTVNSGLTNDSVSSIAINPSGTIFVGTKNGLFRSVQSTTAVRELSADGPISFSLDQNYPNPFNPSTTIRYELPRSSWVSLHVYSVLGQDVAALVNETRPAGVFTERFDAANLASGVYYYRLQAGDFVSTRKMVVLK